MKKPLLLVLAGLALTINACRKSELSNLKDNSPNLEIGSNRPDPTELDEFIKNQLLTKGEFRWAWATDDMIWTALSNSDYVLSVGYQPAGFTDLDTRIHQIDVAAPAWRQTRDAVMALVLENERALDASLTETKLLAFAENRLPYFTVYVRNPETIRVLRASGLVRYAEPIGYEPFMTVPGDRSSSGCGSNTAATGLTTPAHFINIAPGCKQSWNYGFHSIPSAWNNSTGQGCKVVVIDSGCSDAQDNLGWQFNQGYSSGRTIEKYVTLGPTTFFGIPTGPNPTPNDECGHGTSMLGACGAPRGTDGAACGVAYNANLVSIHGADDVYLDESREIDGVSNAFIQAGNDPEARIVSLSLGRLGSVSQLTDAINYAYNQGKLIFAAAGTSFSWSSWFGGVVYPASLSQCVAVTGIKDNLTTRCNACHVGSKVDFVVVMERSSDLRHALSLAMSGDAPSTVGGSSVATATTAGIAALVWSKYPSWTRTQVYTRLRTSASNSASRHPSFGWGRINAALATQ